jgi:hypothetical protein
MRLRSGPKTSGKIAENDFLHIMQRALWPIRLFMALCRLKSTDIRPTGTRGHGHVIYNRGSGLTRLSRDLHTSSIIEYSRLRSYP